MHRCVVNTVVVWLHILGPYWRMFIALFTSRSSRSSNIVFKTIPCAFVGVCMLH